MTTVRNVELTPTMWQALAQVAEDGTPPKRGTREALQTRGLLRPSDGSGTSALTDAGRELLATLESAYEALRDGIRSHRYPWLSRALQDARCDAVARAQNTSEQW